MYNTAIYNAAEVRTLEITEEMEQEILKEFEVESIYDVDAEEVLEYYEGITDTYHAEWNRYHKEITYNFENDYQPW